MSMDAGRRGRWRAMAAGAGPASTVHSAAACLGGR